ncbi:MAG TPA: YciI-like protein [Candidatus Dormibacteraeota bacterium]|nr:YciI-like protein [Candidatus Dormibacteraeota bacterium]
MRWFVLSYDLVDDSLACRPPLRDEHLARAGAARDRGELVLAGALGDPPGQALLVFRAADPSVAEGFARSDPYVMNGLFTRWRVEPWAVVIRHRPGE